MFLQSVAPHSKKKYLIDYYTKEYISINLSTELDLKTTIVVHMGNTALKSRIGWISTTTTYTVPDVRSDSVFIEMNSYSVK